ncbi:helix-turn-helix transcriptional regulator [Marivirga salinae]|uniref:Helix-turn-helix transcriptional regulator n=1 Tax=Marivirga salinarum TaxID=3059078 RepID=A0AA49J9D2_9BACT|nr:helix-turn-helix transcriptional regulator [Marivirga sp. BDSF4-3]WKK75901.2 helix-turn-helix transcriptional regulator [Marivirga sp. BDSF4-3]
MKKREELYKTTEYWLENIQNDIYRHVQEYMEENNLNKAGLARELGFSRPYITQVLNGEFNFSLKKLIELSLAVGKVPIINFKMLEDFIVSKEDDLNYLQNGLHVSFNINNVQLGETRIEEESQQFA